MGTNHQSAVSPGKIEAVDITSARFKADPFPFYARLRAEAPVFPVELSRPFKRRAWLITRYDDALNVLKDDVTFLKDPQNAMTPQQWKKAPKMPGVFSSLQRGFINLDGADHARLRGLVHKAFTPRLVEQWRGEIELLTNELLDAAQAKRHFDLIADFALPLPLSMIARILGVPPTEYARFNRGMKAFISISSSRNLMALPAVLQFMSYLKSLIRERRRHPKDDLISGLVQAQENDSRLSDDEVLGTVFLLLSAGHETTVNLIASGTLALLENPDQFARLQNNPDAALLKSGVEELVRYVTPAETTSERYAREDVTIGGTTIPRGELVLVVIASANRDERFFENGEKLDLGRANNRHLSFGQGIHYCIGAPLSRMEGQIAFASLARRMPGLRLAVPPEQLKWRSSFILRGLEALPVSL